MNDPLRTRLADCADSLSHLDVPDVDGVLTRGRALRRRRRTAVVAAVAASVVVASVGVAAVTGQPGGQAPAAPVASQSPADDEPDLPGRGDVLPGGQRITTVAWAASADATGPATAGFGTAPAAATHLEAEFRCLSAGRFVLPDDSVITCGQDDRATSHHVLPLATSFRVRTTKDARWRAELRWVNVEVLPWGVNARGETYGIDNEQGIPDLVAVEATNGEQGYVRRTDLGDPAPSSPEEALQQQEKGGSREVVVRASDGVTEIGVFVVTSSTPPLTQHTVP